MYSEQVISDPSLAKHEPDLVPKNQSPSPKILSLFQLYSLVQELLLLLLLPLHFWFSYLKCETKKYVQGIIFSL